MPSEPRPEFVRPIAAGAVPRGGREERIAATTGECAALARRFGISAIVSLEATLRLVPEDDGAIRVTGRLCAKVVQDCVVTLEPVAQVVDSPLDLRFRPMGQPLSDDPDAPDEIAMERGTIELGEAVAEQLSLALDPYPRLPEAALPAAGTVKDAPADLPARARPAPFAGLGTLRNKDDREKH